MLFFNLPLIIFAAGHVLFMLTLMLPAPLSQPSIALTQWSNSKYASLTPLLQWLQRVCPLKE
jgi:hypothetical protein